MKRRVIRNVIGCILIIIVLVVITYDFWLTALAKWLIVGDQVIPVDLIVVSTGSKERIYYAIQLWKQKVASKILVLSPNWSVIGTQKRIGDLVVKEMISRGIPRDAIFVDHRPDSTYEDAVYSREWALKLGVTSLIVLEDPFGMRRLRWTFRKVFADTDIQLYYVSVPPELSELTVEKWWTRETELLYVFEEYVKLIFYWIKY
jgi:uncharacterized SAM-binding protein YcdF (DUF218 family)